MTRFESELVSKVKSLFNKKDSSNQNSGSKLANIFNEAVEAEMKLYAESKLK
jgi:hypothetical protein